MTREASDARSVFPPSRTRLGGLDGYRALASLLVLSTHVAFSSGAVAWPVLGAVLQRFDVGVALFFLLSGFLLYRGFLLARSRREYLPRYLVRRAARILPAYWLVVCAALILFPAGVDATSWVRHLTFTQVYEQAEVLRPGLTHLWSLAVEVRFYLVLPVLVWLIESRLVGQAAPRAALRRRLGALLLLSGVSLGTRVAVGLGALPTLAGLWLPPYLDWFAIGMAAAAVAERLRHPGEDRWANRVRAWAGDPWTCLAIAVACFLIATTAVAGPPTLALLTTWESVVRHVAYGASALFLLLPALLVGSTGPTRWLDSAPLRYLGTISYGVFLWHLLLLELWRDALGLQPFQGAFVPLWLLTFASSVTVASASWYLVERPVIRWAHRRRPGGGAASAATAGQAQPPPQSRTGSAAR